MSVRNIVFLDIDGVLNSTRYWDANKPLPMGKSGAIDPAAVLILNEVIAKSGAAVVLSSSWRMQGYEHVQAMLAERGFTGQLIGQTPVKWECPRWAEIEEYLMSCDFGRFVVLDDDPDAWSPESAFADRGLFATTNYIDGIIPAHVSIIVDWLASWQAKGGA